MIEYDRGAGTAKLYLNGKLLVTKSSLTVEPHYIMLGFNNTISGGTTNDAGGQFFESVTFETVDIPEPRIYALIGGLFALAFAGLRRRRR